MAKIVECVPNFSEGRDQKVIDAITKAITDTEGCTVLDVDPGASTNRTVYTFVGSPDNVVNGAINAARAAIDLIDMSKHKGEHPRLGAMDVCPFVPVQNVTMEECVECAEKFGQLAESKLGISVYLYGFAAKEDYRRTVPKIRAGEYEGLAEKIIKDEWKPDFGPAQFNPAWGATMAGARKFLIAYNINVLGTKEQAHRIALNLREKGRGADKPGRLKAVQGIGWYLEEQDIAQISLNLVDFDQTPMHIAFEEAVKDSKELNVAVCGSEVVGMIPLEAMIVAADYYIERDNLLIVSEEQKIRLVVERLGLSSLKYFNPKERIIEYMVCNDSDGPLVKLSLRQFVEAVGSRTSAPGGGSVAALLSSLGSALGLMVSWMTFGNKKFEALDAEVRKLIVPLHTTMQKLVMLIDADTTAFNSYMAALKLPRKTDEEKARRTDAMQEGLKSAIAVPLNVMHTSNLCWEYMVAAAKIGNATTLSDMQVGAKAIQAGVFGAHCNVMINLKDIKDETYKAEMISEADAALESATNGCDEVLAAAKERL